MTQSEVDSEADTPLGPAEGIDDLPDPAVDRDFLKAGSVYQNEYMSLWSTTGVPISVTLRVLDGDRFELGVKNLNSIGGGSKGWFIVKGSFGFSALPRAPGQLQIEPRPAAGEDGFVFDPNVMDRAGAFVCQCLKNMASHLLTATEMTVDTARNTVLVMPRAAAIRMLWNKPVVLHLTPEEGLWTPILEEEGPAMADSLVA